MATKGCMVKMARNSMFGMAGIGIAAAIGFVFALGSLGNTLPQDPTAGIDGPAIFVYKNGTLPTPFALAATQELKKFSSAEELRVFLLGLEQSREQAGALVGGDSVRTLERDNSFEFFVSPQVQLSPGAAQSDANVDGVLTTSESDFSTTNVQVEGVDEPDFLKNDGKYVYILSGDRLTIVDAYPPEDADIAVKIALDIQQG